MEIQEKIRQVIADQLGVKIQEVTETAKFVDDLGADSLDIVELIMELEDKFLIAIPDDEADKLITVGDAIKYIEKRI